MQDASASQKYNENRLLDF